MGQIQKILLARNAMATRFEIALFGEDQRYLRAAGEEALDEIERIEARISPFRPESEIFLLNQYAFQKTVKVSPEVFEVLKISRQIWEITEGAFDITIGPLMKLWGFRGEKPADLSEEIVERTKSCCGMDLIELDETNYSVRFLKPGVQIDLGAIGKGFAIDRAIGILRDNGITSALVHGGTSTAATIGTPPPPEKWRISIELPSYLSKHTNPLLSVVELRDNSLSVSAIWGRKSEIADEEYGHVIDPRSGVPVHNCVLSTVLHESATYSDALSTALLVGGEEIAKVLLNKVGNMEFLIVQKNRTINDLKVIKTQAFSEPNMITGQ
jgi:thiamine biosynthesis lipoprotein